ncbi:hypothetical protein NEHOM01_0461 [Nematocida homosporus]|uniref:uncharacterized protein n=1 Tax=Nematocida homosporus TaxID=1912981 RepID=UPI00222026AC|nr:uncharacterized protein NEHOM01_0461 [Nematocida homosporus]KAI5184910.1 hypothetical protein NEHOM01_0461 [Nematocida homosporus]
MRSGVVLGMIGLGMAYPLLDREKKDRKKSWVWGSAGVLTCFYGGSVLEYSTFVNEKRVKSLSPGGLVFMGGFYSAGLVTGSLAALGIDLGRKVVGGLPSTLSILPQLR